MGLILTMIALAAQAAEPAPIEAHRASGSIHVNGRFDEPSWAEAKPFDSFVESFPEENKAPSMRTEVRVLYDDTNLYIGVKCFDPEPSKVLRNLGRRDTTPIADQLEIAIDSAGDRRTGYSFNVNAGGVLRDLLLFADFNSTDTWDAVWDAAVDLTPEGWTAELEIPLRVLRYSRSGNPWGILVRRRVPRTHQVFDSTLNPRNANPQSPGAIVVSRFGPLTGLGDLDPKRDIELTPYAAARGALRPQFSDPTRPNPRLFDPSIDLGLDFKMALTPELSLTGAVNPDFGQVEADAVIQNLSTAEPFFPEKRPFFLQGLDLFQPVGAEYGSPQQMFYSRRIGLEAPILGAVKLVGSVGHGLDIGVLESLVMGAGNPSTIPVGYMDPDSTTLGPFEQKANRHWDFHLVTPLHFGPNDALPIAHPVATNYLAAVARERFWETSSVGLVFTAATPLQARCTRNEFANDADYLAAGCASRGANALAVDWNLRTTDGVWGFLGQAEGSQQVGGDPAGRVLADGTVMKPNDLGWGGHFRAGKLGGEPFRFDVVYVVQTAKLDLNAVGFQQLTNYQWADLDLHYVKPNGFGPIHQFSLDYRLDLNWTADSRLLERGINMSVQSQAQLPSFDTIGLQAGLEMPQYDTREIYQAGVAFERQTDIFLAAFGSSDPSRALSFSGDIFGYKLFSVGKEKQAWGWGWDGTAIWHPISALETRVDASYGHKPQGARWLETDGNIALFGFQDPAFFSVTLRQQVVITSRLTFQVYAQLFSSAVRYAGGFWSGTIDGKDHLAGSDLQPTTYSGTNPNTHTSALNLNAVLRWEYRLGSTLFVVYSRSQGEYVSSVGPVATSSLPSYLFSGPATDTFMVKWSYWLNI
ncbi:MAG: DUF5916 domain-containing protein [Myxococcaceae bacterium]